MFVVAVIKRQIHFFLYNLCIASILVSLQWYNSGPQHFKIGSPAVMQWRYKLTASEQQLAKDFSMLLWERETSLDSNEWITVAALQPSSGKKVRTDSNIELRNNLTLYINRMESFYFSRFRCSFISSFASSFSDLVVKEKGKAGNQFDHKLLFTA